MNNIKTKKRLLDLHLGKISDKEEEKTASTKQVEKRLLQDLDTGLELGFVIAVPLAGGALLGSYLDKMLGTTPKVTLSLIFLGLIMSGFYFYKIIRDNVRN